MEKQYLKNRLSDITKNKDFQSLKANDKLLFFHLFPLLRVAESVVTIRGQEFKVPEGCYITSRAKLEQALNKKLIKKAINQPKDYISQKMIRNALKRLKQNKIMCFEPVIRFNKNYGVLCYMKNKKGQPKKPSFCLKSFMSDAKRANQPVKRANQIEKKGPTKSEPKLLQFKAEKGQPNENLSEKRANQTTKKGPTIYNKSVLINKNESLNVRAFDSLSEETNLNFKYKNISWNCEEFIQSWNDLFDFYQENFPLKAGKGGFKFNRCSHTPEKLLLIRGWVEQRDQQGFLMTKVWPSWSCFFLSESEIKPTHTPEHGNNSQKMTDGFKFYIKINKEKDKKMRLEQIKKQNTEEAKKDQQTQNEIKKEREVSSQLKEIWNKYSIEYPREAAILRQEASITFAGNTKYLIPAKLQKNGEYEVHFIYIKEKLNASKHFQEFQSLVGRSDGSGEKSNSKEKERAIQ